MASPRLLHFSAPPIGTSSNQRWRRLAAVSPEASGTVQIYQGVCDEKSCRNACCISLLAAVCFHSLVISGRCGPSREGGVYALRALAGITGIASFIMDMTQTLSSWITVKRTAEDIVTWASNRNVEKGCYGYEIADRKTGRQSIRLLTGVALLGLVPLIWLVG